VIELRPAAETRRRLPRLVLGLVLNGIGIALMVAADLGLSPWDVLHQGISERIDVPIGTVGILVGVVVVLGWIPLRQRLGVGTILNVLLIGATIDVVLLFLDEPASLPARVLFMVVGALLWGPGSGLYIGAGLGAGPRDGLMTGIARRGHSVRVVRTGIEIAVLALGWLLGGSVGVGTILFAATIGPNVHLWLDRLRIDDGEPAPVLAEPVDPH
jgi:uncharacterized membrane protein YczE